MLNKKEFIRNRPFDEIDAMDMQNFVEQSIKETVKLITGFGVVEGLNIVADSDMNIKIIPGLCFDNAGNKLEVIQEEIVDVGISSLQAKIAVVTLKKRTISRDNIDLTNKYDLGSDFIYSRDLLVSYEPSVYVGNPSVTPVRPQVPSEEIELAEIRIRASATGINASDIKDTRSFVRKYYLDILHGPTSERPTNPKISQFYFDTDIGKMIVYNGGSWDIIETAAASGDNLLAHTSKTDNPHKVNKGQVGLSNVDNIKQAAKTEFDNYVASNNITVGNKVDKVSGKQLSTEDYTTAEKNKLSGIANNANNYVHPSTHPPSIISQNSTNRFFTDAERTKLQGVDTGANNYTHPSSHPASMITESPTRRFGSDVKFAEWDGKETIAGAQAKANAAEQNARSYTDSKNNFDNGIIIGNYKISVNQINGDLEISLVNP